MDTGSPVRVNTRWHSLFIGRVRPRVHECRTHTPWNSTCLSESGGIWAGVRGYKVDCHVTKIKHLPGLSDIGFCMDLPIQGMACGLVTPVPRNRELPRISHCGALRRSPRLQRQLCRRSRWQKSMLAPAISTILIFTTSATGWHCAGHAGSQKF